MFGLSFSEKKIAFQIKYGAKFYVILEKFA